MHTKHESSYVITSILKAIALCCVLYCQLFCPAKLCFEDKKVKKLRLTMKAAKLENWTSFLQ